MKRLGTIIMLLMVVVPGAGLAADAQVLPEEAAKRLEHIIGSWDCRWEYLDSEGKVKRTVTGTETARWAIEGRVVEFDTEVPDNDSVSRGLMFYSFRDKRFHITSVDQDGAHWHMSGNR